MKTNVLFSALLLGAIACTTSAFAAGHTDEAGLTWYTPREGFDLAKKQHKYVLVDFFTDWCGWCKVLDAKTFPAPNVKPILMHDFVLVKANAEDGGDAQKLAQTYEVRGYPTTMFFGDDGKALAQLTGFKPPNDFEAALKEFLKAAPKMEGSKLLETPKPSAK